MSYLKITSVIASALMIPACATTGNAPATTQFLLGNAVKSNIEAQAVPVDAADKENTYIPADPRRQKLAIERFQKDEVEKPESVNTTQDKQ